MLRGNNSDGSDDNSTQSPNSMGFVAEVLLDQNLPQPVWVANPSTTNNYNNNDNNNNNNNSSRSDVDNENDQFVHIHQPQRQSPSDRQSRRRHRSFLTRYPIRHHPPNSNESTVMSIITHLSNSENFSSTTARNRYLSALLSQSNSNINSNNPGQPVALQFSSSRQNPSTSTASPTNQTPSALYHSNSSKSLSLQCQDCPPILEGLVICVGSYDEKTKQELLMNCEMLGASVRSKYTPDCTHLITLFQMGEDYEKACADSKIVVSGQWLEDCISTRQYIPPVERVIHFPLRQPNGIASMKKLVVSVTGFVGEERSELKFLIRASGARYSGALSKKDNTHLICSVPEGEKYTKALEWGVTVVNRRWLDDCVKEWRRVDETLYKDVGVNR